jgi:hypothetical protein
MPVVPSPKFQLTVYGEVPPVVTAVKVTGEFTDGLAGRKAKLVARGQLVTQTAPKALSKFGAPPSLDVSEASPQAASIVDKYE